MRGGVVGMGMADERSLARAARFMRVQPKREFGQMNRAAHKLEPTS